MCTNAFQFVKVEAFAPVIVPAEPVIARGVVGIGSVPVYALLLVAMVACMLIM